MHEDSVRPELSFQGSGVLAAGDVDVEGVKGEDGDEDKAEDVEKVGGKVLEARKAELMRRPYTPTQAEI